MRQFRATKQLLTFHIFTQPDCRAVAWPASHGQKRKNTSNPEKMDGILILFINNFWFDRNKIREKNIVLHTENMDNSGLINFQPKF